MTLEEVARRAGVSTATVSRVLNGAGAVREATRNKVLAVARELQYHPNVHAQTLARGDSHTIGMIVSNLGNPFFLDIFRSLEQAAEGGGYSVIVENTDYRPERLVESVRSLIGMRPAGIAAIVSEMDASLIEELAGRGMPVVFYDVGHPAPNISSIKVRYELGMQRTVEYLQSLGHSRMAFVGHHATLAPLEARRRTFIETIERYASGAQYTTVETVDSPAGGRQAAAELVASGFRPTAIVCANDFTAIGVMQGLRERNLRVPEDVSVTGFDNIDLAEYTVPTLTTVNVPRSRIGQLCYAAVAARGTDESTQNAIVIEPELVVRGSTGPAAS